MAQFSIKRKVSLSYEDAEQKIRDALSKEGFGILTEIDVKATLKKKLDRDFRKYIILGACNPPYAYRALTIEPEIGVFMPCNVLVYENEDGTATVSAMDPVGVMDVVENPQLRELALEIREKLERAVNSI